MKFEVTVSECERGWGCRTCKEYFDSYEDAKEYIQLVNAENTEKNVPDIYWIADEQIIAVD